MSGSDLLELTLEAHGGLERFRAVREIVARARSGGVALATRFRPFAFRRYEVRVTTGEPHAVVTPFSRASRRGVFDRGDVRLEALDGTAVAERRGARERFSQLGRKLYWDHLDALYFGGYALWNYLTLPFLLVRPGFTVREGEPHEERGERWRRLEVAFPPDVPTHSREQTFFVDARGLLRRHDYTAEVFGSWAKAVHTCHDHRAVGGLVFPMRRRVVPRRADGSPAGFPTLVWIELDSIDVR